MMHNRKKHLEVSRIRTRWDRRARLLRAIRRLGCERLESRTLLTTVINVDPPANSVVGSVATAVSVTFDQDVTAATPQTFVVHGSLSQGTLTAADTTVTTAGAVATHQPSGNFQPGELVRATITAGVTTAGGAATPKVWQFHTESISGSGEFVDSGQVLTSGHGNRSDLGDVDQDGDVDALGDNILLNDGTGVFTDSGQTLGSGEFVDVDGDGDLDVVRDNVFLNDGNGIFIATGQSLGGGNQGFGDLDGDGDIDVVKGVNYAAKRVWLNNGSGTFTDTGQALGTLTSLGIEVGDLDGDGDLDFYSANFGGPNRVWLNNGNATFTDTGQALGGFSSSRRAIIGDIDNDGDLDAIVADDYGTGGPTVWLNDGDAAFTSAGSFDAGTAARSVTLGDLDADGDLDAVVGSLNGARVWENDGAGAFSGGTFLTWDGFKRSRDVDLGDVDGDGDLDLFTANYTAAGARLFINQNLEPNVTLSVDNGSIVEAAGTATVTATLSAAHTEPVTIDLEVTGTATLTDDYTVSGTQVVIPAGQTTGSITIAAVQDTVDDDDETVVVDITNVTGGQEGGTQQVTVTIVDDDDAVVPDVTLSVDNASIPEASGIATFTASLSAVTTEAVTIDLGLSGTAAANDFTASGTQIVVAPGATSGSITVTAVQDMDNEPDETVIVDITNVTGGNEVGTQRQTTTITDDDDPPKLTVIDVTPTESGFTAEFSTDLNTAVLNLYDTVRAGMGGADVTLQGAAVGTVAGSLVVDPSVREVTFVKSGGPLAADTYTVTLRSGVDGFVDVSGQLLDGNDDGTEGDNYTSQFTIAEPAANSVTIGIPDIVRGPGQAVNLPADATNGFPVTISEGTNVRAVDLRVGYDPNLLTITGGIVGADAPSGASVIANTSTPGLAIFVFFSTTPLAAGPGEFLNVQATVPTTDPSGIYGMQQVLDLQGVIVSDGNDNEAPAVVDDAFHLVSFFGDVSGNGRLNAADAAGIARNAALLESGFGASLRADPLVVGDISGNNRLNAADASLLAQSAALITVPQIPAIPGGVIIASLDAGSLRSPLPSRTPAGPPQSPASSGSADHSNGDSAAGFVFAPASDQQPAIDRVMAELGTRIDQEIEPQLSLEDAIHELLGLRHAL